MNYIRSILVLIFMVVCTMRGHSYAELLHATTWADYLCYDKQHTRAQSWYHDYVNNELLPYPLRSYSLYLFQTQQFATLLDYKKQLQDHFKDDLNVQKAIAVALAHEKKNNESEGLFIALAHQFPTAYEVVIPAAQMLINRGDDAQAQQILEKLLNNRQQKQLTPVCMVLLAQLYLKAHNVDGAHTLMTQCVTYQPSYAPAWLILGTLEELKQNQQAALQAYRTFISLSPISVPEIEKRIVALQLGHNPQTQRTSTQQSPIQQIMALIVQKKYDAALSTTKQALLHAPEDAALRAIYIHLLVTNGFYKAAIAQLMHYIDQQPDDYRWWGALHIIALNPASSSEALRSLRCAHLRHPYVVWGYLYEGDCALRRGEYRQAHDLCTSASLLTHDEVMQTELLFMQALAGYEMHDYVRVAQAVEKGLQSSVIHAPLYNLAAYYYAHIGNFERAQQLIVHCCSLEPHNYHYHDTAAFIAYKKGDVENASKAFTLLQQAHTDDAAIALHASQAARKKDQAVRARKLLAHAENHAYSEYIKRRLRSLQTGTV